MEDVVTAAAGAAVTALFLTGAPAHHWHDDAARVQTVVAGDIQAGASRVGEVADCLLPPLDVVIVHRYYISERHRQHRLYSRPARGAALPRGWERRLQPLPVVVDRRLSMLPGGLRRAVLDGTLVVYDEKNERIADAVAIDDLP
jgi:hypothetical protein